MALTGKRHTLAEVRSAIQKIDLASSNDVLKESKPLVEQLTAVKKQLTERVESAQKWEEDAARRRSALAKPPTLRVLGDDGEVYDPTGH
jgi:uncharacterized coiled-coil protein SlyX